jgi:tol-pal system protein YbgF
MITGCVATSDDLKGVYVRQNRLEARTEQLSQDVEALKRKAQATNENDLKAQVDELQDKLKNEEQSYSNISGRLDKLEQKTEEVSIVPPSQQPQVPTGGTTVVAPSNEETVFNEGYKNLGEGKYKDARERFKLFISKYPNASKAPDAQYWLAESYYREGKFEEAILTFQKFIDTYPKDSRVPLSYLKQGLSLINIGRKEEARLFLQTLIDKFPKSEEARVAQEKLGELEGKR